MESKIRQRTRVLLQEAKKKGYTLTMGKSASPWITLENKDRIMSFREFPQLNSDEAATIMRHKSLTNQFLEQHGLPTAQGHAGVNPWASYRAARSLGFPLVVKPSISSFSLGASFPLNSWGQFFKALIYAKRFSTETIVEQFKQGRNYRVIVIGHKVVAAVERLPANVRGDGRQTIQQLIDQKNKDPRRGHPKEPTATLHHITLDQKLKTMLKVQGYCLTDIPCKGEFVKLDPKIVMSRGGDTKEVKVHLSSGRIFSRITKLLGASFVGLDCIMDDITKPWADQDAVLTDLNSLPFIDMHHEPTWGKPINVAKQVLTEMERQAKKGRSTF